MSASAVRIVSDTKGAGLRALASRVARMNKRVLVGVPAGTKEADGTSLALVAAVNEFGSSDGRIPERSFLRAGIRKNMPTFVALNAGNLKRIANGTMSEDTALGRLGVVAAGAVKEYIRDGSFTPNAPSTIKRKKSDKPLIDSGALRQSITHKIEATGPRLVK